MNLEKITLMVAVVLTFAYITIPGFLPIIQHEIGILSFANGSWLSINSDLIAISVFFMPYILLRLWRAK
jgi:hypothetical protein